MMSYYILLGAIALASAAVSQRLKSKFRKYEKLILSNGLSGREIAEKMLSDHQITDVQIISTPGRLSDHYNPINKTVNLSESVFSGRNAAAAAVAAHEVGHAVQHARAYKWLTMRSQLVPIVSVASGMSSWIVFIGLILMFSSGSEFGYPIALLGLGLMGVATVFSFITLPVEYDASERALQWLVGEKVLTSAEHEGAKDALNWAARTYVVAALGALASLLYWGLQVMRARD
ncbi:MAG: zinc metallopeptidase [Bacteroidetes bacterium]|nr:zinc metallopeptidase [Bacteroidota bacterium]MDA0950261.1 zinc metallopeptidase [Bacteroidota bacterium]